PIKEDYYFGLATERLFLPVIKTMCPQIVDWFFIPEGVFHNCLVIAVKKPFPGAVRATANFVWGNGQLMNSKMIIFVDENINPSDTSCVLWKVFNNIDATRDIFFYEGSLDVLDHSSKVPCYGSKIYIDATAKNPDENNGRIWPDEAKSNEDIIKHVNENREKYGL
ncbi:MAG: UbiD family decarboxylase, partial [Oscillospiraceae bacterium]